MFSESVHENEKLPIRLRLYRRLLAAFGWKLVFNTPVEKKFLVICAHHTSLWDYPLFLSAILSFDRKCQWLGHTKAFRGLFGPIVRYFGGYQLPENPNISFVDRLRNEFDKNESLIFCLAPEGSSSFVPRWRSGFYHAAVGSRVPIVFGFVDYKNKSLGLGDYFTPTGNIQKDLQYIRSFYSKVSPKYPDRAGLIKL